MSYNRDVSGGSEATTITFQKTVLELSSFPMKPVKAVGLQLLFKPQLKLNHSNQSQVAYSFS
jgi:hypothetical protein